MTATPPGPPPSGPPPPYGPPAPPPYPPTYQPGWASGPPRKPSRARLVLAILAAVVVLAAAVVVPVVLLRGDDDDRPTDARSDAPSTGSSSPPAGLGEVETYADLPTTHVTDEVDYEQTPPAGGPHFAEWLDCGVYDTPVQDENAVHDLEHGAVWITYDPDLGEDDVATLEDALPQNGIMSPYDDLPAPVVVTVWGVQLALTGADDPRLGEFVDTYESGDTAPEPFASCAGGTAGGTPA